MVLEINLECSYLFIMISNRLIVFPTGLLKKKNRSFEPFPTSNTHAKYTRLNTTLKTTGAKFNVFQVMNTEGGGRRHTGIKRST